MKDEAALARIRRGLGFIFLLSGLIHGGEMVLAILYSGGKIPFVITAALWSELYFAHFLFTVLGSVTYLTLNFYRSNIFFYETLVDFLLGFVAFVLLMSASAFLLVRHLLPTWTAVAPSLFLAGYGLFLRAGRSWASNRADASAKP